jgi:hypothetical protein
MSTGFRFKEPPNTVIFFDDTTCLTAVYDSKAVKIDKKTKEVFYSVKWTMSRYNNYRLRFLGVMETSLEATNDAEAEERIEELAGIAIKIMLEANSNENKDDVLTEHDGREVIAAIHARWMSRFLNDETLDDAVLKVRAFLKEMNIKNTKKLLSELFNNKVVEDIKNKELK